MKQDVGYNVFAMDSMSVMAKTLLNFKACYSKELFKLHSPQHFCAFQSV